MGSIEFRKKLQRVKGNGRRWCFCHSACAASDSSWKMGTRVLWLWQGRRSGRTSSAGPFRDRNSVGNVTASSRKGNGRWNHPRITSVALFWVGRVVSNGIGPLLLAAGIGCVMLER